MEYVDKGDLAEFQSNDHKGPFDEEFTKFLSY